MFDLRRFSYISSSPLWRWESGRSLSPCGWIHQTASLQWGTSGGWNEPITDQGWTRTGRGRWFQMWEEPVWVSVSGFFHSGQFVFSPSASLSGLCLSLVHNVQRLDLRLEEECVCVCLKHKIGPNMHSSMCQAERSPVVIQGAATVLEQQKSDMKLKLGGLELEVFYWNTLRCHRLFITHLICLPVKWMIIIINEWIWPVIRSSGSVYQLAASSSFLFLSQPNPACSSTSVSWLAQFCSEWKTTH